MIRCWLESAAGIAKKALANIKNHHRVRHGPRGRSARRAARLADTAVAKKTALVWKCAVVDGVGSLVGGAGIWSIPPLPLERPLAHVSNGSIGPIAYFPPEWPGEQKPGEFFPVILPPLSLPPEVEILGPPALLPEQPIATPTQPAQPMPEPSAAAILAAGLAALWGVRRHV